MTANRGRWLVGLVVAVGCASGTSISVHSDASVRYRASGLQGVDTVALLPPRLDASLESYRDTIGAWLLVGLNRHHAAVRFWPADTAAARLAAADVVDTYVGLVDHRRKARGELEGSAVAALARGAGVRWLLYTDLSYTDAEGTERWLTALSELWDGFTGTVVWQARAECRTAADGREPSHRRRQVEALTARCLGDLAQRFLTPPRAGL